MGGSREIESPAKSTSGEGETIGMLRIHENQKEIHFHDDKNKLKTAVPVATMFDAWQKLSEGKKKKFRFVDATNGTELRIKMIKLKRQNGTFLVDPQMEVVPSKKKNKLATASTSSEFQKFDQFIKG